ncbi:MAG TPA: phage holin family protein [Candidatus Saccharibacteria bacterium]|nr:phage holin family protein [Candidatus Saccharibacteria bacterium]HRK94553.1 phage holin family protein [Candidatus Saccharibacteria bacterium]
MRRQLIVFLIRWLLNSFGLWIAVRLFGTGYEVGAIDAGAGVFLVAGLIFSIINSILRPLVIVVSLPAILLTLGLFTFIVNGLMVYISLALTPGLQMTFWHSVITGIILSLINYIVSSALEIRYESIRKES